MVRTPNDLKLLALVKDFNELVNNVELANVAKDIYLYCLIHRGLQDVARVTRGIVFPRWFRREAGVVPVQSYTFLNISHKAKLSLEYLAGQELIESVNYSARLGELFSYRMTEAGKRVLESRRGEWDDDLVQSLSRCNRCGSHLTLEVNMDDIVPDPLGAHVRALLRCSNEGCTEEEDLEIIHIVTEAQAELLYLMSRFTHEGDFWITHNALRILIYEGIQYQAETGRDVFGEWDYAPNSVRFARGRRYVNISQEAEDDLNDLRELGLIEEMRIEGSNKQYHTKYQIGEEGRKMVPYLPDELKEAVNEFVRCKKCGAETVRVQCGLDRAETPDDCLMQCREEDCGFENGSMFAQIEDVSYVSVPFWYGSENPVPSKTEHDKNAQPRRQGV
jgi:DNA-binding PadR family transcriptional regulator